MSGYNPTLTIFAQAYRQGDFIKREIQSGGELVTYV
jgi:hypothetical protein